MHVTASGQGLVSTGMDALPPFRLHRPTSLAEARQIQAREHDVVWAHGNTDLVAQFREGLRPQAMVSLRRVRELDAVIAHDHGLRIGAGVTHDAAARHPVLAAFSPQLRAYWSLIANPRVRFRATLGGNLMARRNRYELALLLGVIGGVASVFTSAGRSDVPIADLWDMQAGSALLEYVALPASPSLVYTRHLRPLMTLALGRPADGRTRVAVGSAAAPPWFADVTEERPDQIGDQVAAALPAEASFFQDRSVCLHIVRHVAVQAARQLDASQGGPDRGRDPIRIA